MTDGMNGERPGLALVTGASSGIGLALAEEFVAHGHDVLVVAEDDEIHQVPARLREAGDGTMTATVTVVQADLATRPGVETLLERVRAMPEPLAVAAINAGVSVAGPFVETDVEDHLRLIDLNVTGAVLLAHGVLRDMVRRGDGAVLFTSSVGATMPSPWEATYNASKSFLLSFAEALRVELRDQGVTITTLMPGPTDTEFFERAGLEDTRLGQMKKDDPRDVARDGYEALMEGEDHVVAGSMKNKAQAVAGKFAPYEQSARAHGKLSEPGSGSDG
jgi:short-subunit dehydrogenase